MDVEEGEACLFQGLVKVAKGDFGGVVLAVEHGFAGEESADGDAVKSADKLGCVPSFDGVGVSELVEVFVGEDEFLGDPAVFAIGSAGAVADNLAEGLVEGDAEWVLAQAAFEASGDVKAIPFEDGARIGRPPSDGFDGPRKEADLVGFEQLSGTEVASNGDEIGGRSGVDCGLFFGRSAFWIEGGCFSLRRCFHICRVVLQLGERRVV